MPLSSSVEQLKARVEELTGVHANMQKLLYKGQLKNESTLKQAGVLDGVKILLMASKVEDIVKLAAAASTAPVIAAPMVVPKVPLSERPEHRKILDKGKPDDLEPGLFGRKLPLPAEGLRRMLTSRGDKCRLTFKLELDELHINTNERTQKVQMGAIKAVTSEPIKDHEEYHILILRLGPTEKSNVFFYWVPCQYVDSAKTNVRLEATPTPITEPEPSIPYLPPPSWIDDAPRSVQPYLHLVRLDKPAGTYLLFLPCGWSIAMASCSPHAVVAPATTFGYLALFGVGALVMRGAGCTINDLWDRDLDKKVWRTRSRPLAAGTVTPVKALAFLGAQLSVGLGVLMQLNWYSILLGTASLLPVITYPLMKRITYWPQVVLGTAFNYGTLLGWSAVLGACNWQVCIPLYLAGISWTLVYDTIYALQDKSDDIKAGIKSTALRFGDNLKPWLSLFATTSVAGFAAAGYANEQGAVFYALSVAGPAAHFAWQIRTLAPHDPVDAARKFRSNAGLGVLVLTGILADGALSAPAEVESNPIELDA
ncbi:Para-hydroxybenzoate--polyprenyltransferase, mitochondrial precursor (PHB:polyprenyltransferase), partial [Thoreauomyces humboldtii]